MNIKTMFENIKFLNTTDKKNSYTIVAVTVFAMGCVGIGCANNHPIHPPMKTVSQVNINRYLGTWYEQSSIPNRFQSVCARNTIANYAMDIHNDDANQLTVTNRCTRTNGTEEKVKGVAKVVSNSNNSKLRVSFFRPFYGDYWILALAPDYSWVLVGEPSRKYGWILSRQPRLDESTLQLVLQHAQKSGYATGAFVTTLQSNMVS